jgi:phage terminase small subunit
MIRSIDRVKPAQVRADRIASRLWDHYRVLLDEAGRWRDCYASAFAPFVFAYADYLRLREQVAKLRSKDGGAGQFLATSSKGSRYTHPLVNLELAKGRQVVDLGAKFGLNPLADKRMNEAAASGDLGPLFDLLKGPPTDGV